MKFKILLSGISFIVAILLVEYVSRQITPSKAFLDANTYVPIYEQFGSTYKLKSNYEVRITTSLYSFLHKTNSHGLRQDKESQDKDSKILRVAFLGDSMTYGLGVENNETFPSLLDSPSFETLNFGVIGYGPYEEKELFEDFVVNFAPDVTVLCFLTGNDLDEVADGPGRYEIIGDGFLWDKAAEHTVKYRFKFMKTTPVLKNIHYSLIKRSNLYNIIIYGVDYTVKPVDYNNAFEKTAGVISEIKKIADANGSRLVLLVIPTTSIEVLGTEKERPYFLRGFPLNSKLEELTRENDIGFLDLLEDFRNYPNPEKLYFKFDGHLTPEGHKFVALKLGDFLKVFNTNEQ